MLSLQIKYYLLISYLFLITHTLSAHLNYCDLNIKINNSTETLQLIEFSGTNPKGIKLSVNNRYFEHNNRPWYPLMGEFHYWRFPSEYWEEQIIKMKSGGLQIVATYVYWGAHEKPKGNWNWNERLDLRHFIELCQKHNMFVWLRPGPYINGDVRGRGFPDWIYTMTGCRSNNQQYLDLVSEYFIQVGKQAKGLWFKDGGPIIGVQLENEYASGDSTHISQLKQLAQKAEMSPVYWSVTANTLFQDKSAEVLPLQGAYCYRGWESGKPLTTDFLFAADQWIMEKNLGQVYYNIDQYPRGTCEQGAGMQETHGARFIVEPQVIEAHANNQIGRGINMLGYFMFQGGTQYPGTEMPLSDGAMMPSGLVSYDYQAPLDEFGRSNKSYDYLKLQHLFLTDFGDRIVTTNVFRPEGLPSDPNDLTSLRYTGRFNKQGEGFFFFCNTQNYRKMPDKELKVRLTLPEEQLEFPRKPFVIRDKCIATWPINFTFEGVKMKYATAQVLCKIGTKESETLFLYETEGISAEICLQKKEIKSFDATEWMIDEKEEVLFLTPKKFPATATFKKRDGKKICITVLSRQDAEMAWKTTLHGQDYLFITKAEMLFQADRVIARQIDDPFFSFRVFPSFKVKEALKTKKEGGLFSNFTLSAQNATPPCTAIIDSDSSATITLKSKLPEDMSDIFAEIIFDGNMGFATLKGRRVADRLWYGKEWSVGLKRFLPEMLQQKSPLNIEIEPHRLEVTPNKKIVSIKIRPEYEVILK